MISKVVEKVIPEVAKSGSDFLNNPGPVREIVSEIAKTAPELAKNSAGAATEVMEVIVKSVPEVAKNPGQVAALAGEIVKTGTAIAKNPGVVSDVVKTGIEVVKKGIEILPDPSDFEGLAELVQAASSGKEHVATRMTLKYSL